jgi:hypothetical protein
VTGQRLFLGVRRSVTGLAWEHRLNERQENIALAIAQGHGVSDIVARVLAGATCGRTRRSASSIRPSATCCRIR